MKAVDVGIGQPGPGLMLGAGGRREENVLFESSGGLVGEKTDEAHGGHDRFELLVCHNGLEGSRVPQRQFPHTLLHLDRSQISSECWDYRYWCFSFLVFFVALVVSFYSPNCHSIVPRGLYQINDDETSPQIQFNSICSI